MSSGAGLMQKTFLLLLLISTAMPRVGQTPASARPDEWRQFRGNPHLTGVATGTVSANLKLLWTY